MNMFCSMLPFFKEDVSGNIYCPQQTQGGERLQI